MVTQTAVGVTWSFFRHGPHFWYIHTPLVPTIPPLSQFGALKVQILAKKYFCIFKVDESGFWLSADHYSLSFDLISVVYTSFWFTGLPLCQVDLHSCSRFVLVTPTAVGVICTSFGPGTILWDPCDMYMSYLASFSWLFTCGGPGSIFCCPGPYFPGLWHFGVFWWSLDITLVFICSFWNLLRCYSW